MRVWPRRLLQLLITMMLMTASVVAAAGEDFPGSKPDRRILKTQQKVDSLFEKGDYARAYFIYREELAPLGDKYAQYMVGYMNITGKGVEKDHIAGSAWYRLAAERGDAHFSKARDEVWALFSDEQRLQSDERYAELRLEYSDAMIVAGLAEKDLEFMEKPVPTSKLALSVDVTSINNAERARLRAVAASRLNTRLGVPASKYQFGKADGCGRNSSNRRAGNEGGGPFELATNSCPGAGREPEYPEFQREFFGRPSRHRETTWVSS